MKFEEVKTMNMDEVHAFTAVQHKVAQRVQCRVQLPGAYSRVARAGAPASPSQISANTGSSQRAASTVTACRAKLKC